MPSAAGRALGSSPFVLLYYMGAADCTGANMVITAARKAISAFVLTTAVLGCPGARADGPPAPTDLVSADLVAETASIAPNATVWVDLRLAIKPGWHVYWQN